MLPLFQLLQLSLANTLLSSLLSLEKKDTRILFGEGLKNTYKNKIKFFLNYKFLSLLFLSIFFFFYFFTKYWLSLFFFPFKLAM